MASIKEILNKIENVDFTSINVEFFITKAYEIFIEIIPSKIKDFNKKLKQQPSYKGEEILFFDENFTSKRLLQNYQFINNWCESVNFKDLAKEKSLKQIFISIDFYLTPKRVHFDSSKETLIPLTEIDFTENHTVILGKPGAGKTTLMQYICLIEREKLLANKYFIFPFLIRFRDINYRNYETLSFFDILIESFGLSLKIVPPEKISYKENLGIEVRDNIHTNEENFRNFYIKVDKLKFDILIEFLNNLNILLILDGFDEIPFTEVKRAFFKEIEKLISGITPTTSKIILTSRTGEFDYNIKNTQTFEIAELNHSQIELFAKNWFINIEESNLFINQLNNSPLRDTAILPLNIAHLCAIFERMKEIPEQPRSIYKRIVQLLLEDWNVQNDIHRKSKYSQFTVDNQIDFLSKLAYILTVEYKKTTVNSEDLKDAYLKICSQFNLPRNEVKSVVNEIESHNGLFIQSGFDKFEFSHKSIQEYLTAEFLKDQYPLDIGISNVIEIPNEMAISVALSNSPSNRLCYILFPLVNHIFRNYQNENNLDIYKYDRLDSRSYNEIFQRTHISNNSLYSFLTLFFKRLVIEKPNYEISVHLGIVLFHTYNLLKNIDKFPHILHDFFGLTNIKKSMLSLKEIYKFFEVRLNGEVKYMDTLLKDDRDNKIRIKSKLLGDELAIYSFLKIDLFLYQMILNENEHIIIED